MPWSTSTQTKISRKGGIRFKTRGGEGGIQNHIHGSPYRLHSTHWPIKARHDAMCRSCLGMLPCVGSPVSGHFRAMCWSHIVVWLVTCRVAFGCVAVASLVSRLLCLCVGHIQLMSVIWLVACRVASRLGTLPSRLLCRSLVSGHFRVHTRQARRVNAASTRPRGISTREAGQEWGSGPKRFQKLFGNCCNALAYLDIITSITVMADMTLTGKFRKV
ncbi:uncharacterized protein LACBIDRAFT_317953 [Laccaria bicolor S238N-H82]|uniref:Predicted protein n=1 Tax=Laccaria bicolor (strain S238N-H82 / ATCC MYA-4686) TaxID=486041 RepID=B0D5L4_LACBS|nr:uncharacterized protein LACBIDRAFT_317953 [Laccaria bicolor S238N-H82]EDR09793.1 predicted protein [Laccaria bicolor S238N-H82]|eukprot:XP_001879178.1 predicted protein [Laccaria bicolor S238N-H82]